MENTWNVEKVKEELPTVKVSVNGVKTTGDVRGRKLDFALVKTDYGNFEFAWETIVRVLNNDSTLIA